MQNEDSWEQSSEQLGWSVADCLNHKLSFKKKEDPKAKHEAMGQHIKRLRAAGWHLLHVMERFASDPFPFGVALQHVSLRSSRYTPKGHDVGTSLQA